MRPNALYKSIKIGSAIQLLSSLSLMHYYDDKPYQRGHYRRWLQKLEADA